MSRRWSYVALAVLGATAVWLMAPESSGVTWDLSHLGWTSGGATKRGQSPTQRAIAAGELDWGAAAARASWTPRAARISTARATPPPPPSPRVDGEFRLMGRARTGAGQVLGDAEVLLQVQLDGVAETRSVRSDAEGSFEFVVPVGTRLIDVALAPVEGRAAVKLELRQTPRLEGERSVLLEVPLGSVVSGTVWTQGDNYAAGAIVDVWLGKAPARSGGRPPELSVRADVSGRYRLAGLTGRFFAAARTDSLVPEEGFTGQLEEGSEVLDADLRVARPATLQGVVLSDGVPVPGVVVQVGGVLASGPRAYSSGPTRRLGGGPLSTFEPTIKEARTDSLGRFRVEQLPERVAGPARGGAQGGFRVGVDEPGYTVWQSDSVDASRPLTVELGQRTGVFGRVMEGHGAPLGGAKVVMHTPYDGVLSGGATPTGEFAFEGVRGGPLWDSGSSYTVLVHRDGFAARQVEVDGPWVRGAQDGIEVVLEQERLITGVVLDHAGLPLAGAPMRIMGDERYNESVTWGGQVPSLLFGLGMDKTTTDARGRFRFGGLYRGTFELETGPLYGGSRTQIDSVKGGELDVVVRIDRFALEGVILAGRVVDALTGLPVREFTVWPTMVSADDPSHDTSSTQGVMVADERGQFRVEGLYAGEFRISMGAPGYSRAPLPLQSFGPGEHTLVVRLDRSNTVEFVVRDASGARVDGGSIHFQDAHGNTFQLASSDQSGMTSSSVSLRGGAGRVRDVPREPLRLIFGGSLGREEEWLINLFQHRGKTLELTLGK